MMCIWQWMRERLCKESSPHSCVKWWSFIIKYLGLAHRDGRTNHAAWSLLILASGSSWKLCTPTSTFGMSFPLSPWITQYANIARSRVNTGKFQSLHLHLAWFSRVYPGSRNTYVLQDSGWTRENSDWCIYCEYAREFIMPSLEAVTVTGICSSLLLNVDRMLCIAQLSWH